MDNRQPERRLEDASGEQGREVKLVAEMPEDPSEQELRQMKEQDGYPDSCGGL